MEQDVELADRYLARWSREQRLEYFHWMIKGYAPHEAFNRARIWHECDLASGGQVGSCSLLGGAAACSKARLPAARRGGG